METRSDTTIPISKQTKSELSERKPAGTPWDAYLRDVVGIEDLSNPTREDTERAIEAVAKLAEDAGVAPAEEFSEAVTERLEVDA